MRQHPSFALPFLAAVGMGLSAQQPEPPIAMPAAHAQGVFRCDDQLIAIGANYKAYFRAGEVEFVPAFGRAAPHNVPLRLRATSMARGGAVVPFVASAPERRGDDRVQFARAAGVVEVFTALERGLEQAFVFTERPAGQGDLVVECDLHCEVAGVPDGAGGLSFFVPGVGPFPLGAVTGIAADGDRVRGTVHLEGSKLSLSLPAAFVERAAYPLVLDPLLGGPTLVSGLDREDAGIVHDPATGDWLAVWAVVVTSGDTDIHAQRISQATGSPVGGSFPIDASTVDTTMPRVAAVRVTGRVLVAYRRPGGLFSAPTLWGRTVQVSAQAVSIESQLANFSGNNFAVASEDTTADNEALLVWGNGTIGTAGSGSVLAVQVTVTAAGAPIAGTPVTIASGLNNPYCSISKTNGGTGNYLIAWRDVYAPLPISGPHTLYSILVSRNLSILTPVRILANDATGTPAIDSSGGLYLVAYERWEAGQTTYRDIMCAGVLHFAAFGVLTVTSGPLSIEATAGQDEADPDVAWVGQRFVVTFDENFGTTTENAAAWLVNPDCTHCSTRMSLGGVNLTSSYTLERVPRVAGRAHFVAGAEDGEIVYGEDSTVTPHPIVVGQRVLGVGPGGTVTDLGGGCGQGGTATSTTNGFALGNTDCRFEVTGLAAGALPLCCLGVPAATIPCGGCTFVNPLASFFEPNVAGAAAHAFVVPCDPIYLGFQMEVQWLSLLAPTSPCPLVSGMTASNRVRFTVGP